MLSRTLCEIAEIKSGQAFKGALVDDPYGDYLIMGSDSVRKGFIDKGAFIKKSSADDRPFKRIKENDVLICAKTNQNRAFVFSGVDQIVVANSYFQIVSIFDADDVIPGYLAWYLNHPEMQDELKKLTSGSTVQHLTIKKLGSITVKIPPIENQVRIVKAAGYVAEKLELLQLLSIKTEKYWNDILMGDVKALCP